MLPDEEGNLDNRQIDPSLVQAGRRSGKIVVYFFLEFRANPTFGCPEKVSKIWYGYIIYDTLRRRTYMFMNPTT